MPLITTSKSDVIWSYVGTVVSMASGFVLLPLLLTYLSDEELGLWYVYLAIANLAQLFEFGFNPTFARNIVYVVSGARRLSAKGCDTASVKLGVDWHLLNVVIRACKFIYAGIAVVTLVLLATVGSAYVAYVASVMDVGQLWTSWTLFVVAIVTNLYFLYAISVLRGYGDIAGENRAKTFAKLVQLALSAALLVLGFGLVGAAVGYLANSILMRIFALMRMRLHREIEEGRRSDEERVSMSEVKSTVCTVGTLAWRDGLVQLAAYASTQAMTIMSSLFLGLAESGTYSVLLQLGTAVYNFANVYPKSYYPSMQAASAEGDGSKQRHIVSSGLVAYWCLFVFGVAGVCLVILPILPVFKPTVIVNYGLFLGMCVYLALWDHHSVCCNYIISMNEVPYMIGYLISSVLGVALVWVFCGGLCFGAWGIVLGQAVSQIVYNNWKWPMYLCGKLDIGYSELMRQGAAFWSDKLRRALGKRD